MKVFKFGGASVKDANSVKNVATIIEQHSKDNLVVVISAMGKSTNALEEIIHCITQKSSKTASLLADLKTFHTTIVKELNMPSTVSLTNDIENLFLEMECMAEHGFEGQSFDYIYDQLIGFGELLSTKIVSSYLLSIGMKNQWVDARNFILTSSNHRDARVRWPETEHMITMRMKPLATKNLIITQGFIGKGLAGETTSLGREGSDYSAAVFAYCLNAESVTIWKDVAGLMNADPKKFEDAQLISHISYRDTIELAYYGASVIHPKTMQPLKSKKIPLLVKSFLNPEMPGTIINEAASELNVPCFIHKDKQLLLRCKTKDFTFIVEDQVSQIMGVIAKHGLRVAIMQNSALSFTVAGDLRGNSESLITELDALGFETHLQTGLQLLTVYNSQQLPAQYANTHVLVRQNTDTSAHYLFE